MSVKRTSSFPIVETPRLSVYCDLLSLADGTEVERLRVSHPGAVVILAVHEDVPAVVLVEQYRRALGRRILELPAGTLEAGEDALSCAQRELREETGYQAARWEAYGELYPAPGFCDEIQHLFLARQLSEVGAQPEATEDLRPLLLPLAELRERVRLGEICDGKTLAALYRAEIAGVFRGSAIANT